MENIQISIIKADGANFNSRGTFGSGSVDTLVQSIRDKGLLQPVVVNRLSNGDVELVAGFRRLAACQILGWDTIPCVVKDNLTEIDARLMNIEENLQRKDLNVMQEARAVQALVKLALNDGLIAKRLGVSIGWVRQRLDVMNLPADIQGEILAGNILLTNVKDLLLVKDKAGTQRMYEYALKIKEARQGNRKAPALASRKRTTGVHTASEIGQVVNHFYEVGVLKGADGVMTLDGEFVAKSLNWACGNITDKAYKDFIIDYAEKKGLDYTPLDTDSLGHFRSTATNIFNIEG